MNNKLSPSFIPKQSISSNLRERREPLSLVIMISVIIFVIALVYFASIFGYRFYVYNLINRPCPTGGESTQSCGLRESLEREKRDFQYESLARLKRLDTKLKNGSTILTNHQTLRPLFEQLSLATAHNVKFNDFKFNKNVIEISGAALGYEDVAYQSKIFTSEVAKTGEDRKITAFSFSNFDLDSSGNVIFKLTLTVDPSLLSFVKNS
ncbi:MAG: hypothetical protein WCX70_00785 [Candidatus Paceibacterota bacterium]|jgi:hypothetical protein